MVMRVKRKKESNKEKFKVDRTGFSAGTILTQLGGNKFIVMTGAKEFWRNDKTRQIGFKIGRNSESINHVRIKLNSMDTYDMEFLQVRGTNIKVKSKAEGIYNDQLQSVFTKHTGMYTHL